MQANLISLEQMYLLVLAKAFEAMKFQVAVRENGPSQGTLWVLQKNTTAAVAFIHFQFREDNVAFAMTTRSEQEAKEVVKYVEGVDGYVQKCVRALQSGMLEDKSKKVA